MILIQAQIEDLFQLIRLSKTGKKQYRNLGNQDFEIEVKSIIVLSIPQ